jgi:hypothetical protein
MPESPAMAADAFKDLQRRVFDAVRTSVKLREERRRRPAARPFDGAPPAGDCDWPRIHRYLTQVLAALDSGFAGPERRLVRSRLIREATCACVYVRMQQIEPLRVSLQAMLGDAMRLPLAGEDGQKMLELRRLIRLALVHAGQTAPP